MVKHHVWGKTKPEGTGDQFTACFPKAVIKYERNTHTTKRNETKQNK